MNELIQIEKKIKELLRKKEQLRLKAANDLYKKLETLLGEDFSPEIVLGMIIETWSNVSAAQKQQWHQHGAIFFRPQPGTKTTKNSATHHQVTTTHILPKTPQGA